MKTISTVKLREYHDIWSHFSTYRPEGTIAISIHRSEGDDGLLFVGIVWDPRHNYCSIIAPNTQRINTITAKKPVLRESMSQIIPSVLFFSFSNRFTVLHSNHTNERNTPQKRAIVQAVSQRDPSFASGVKKKPRINKIDIIDITKPANP